MRIIIAILVIGFALTGAWLRGETNFEHGATRAAIFYELPAACPLSQERVKAEDVGFLSICSTFGIGAYEAAKRYPEYSRGIFATYGGVEELRKILDQYGHVVLPIIQYFRERGSTEFRIRARMREVWDRLRGNADVKPIEFTPDQYGLIAIHEINRRGHNLLAEFEIVDSAQRKHVKRAINAATELFTSGITDLEAAIVRGEEVTWKQVGFAALDATIVIGGASALVKTLKVGKAASKGAVLTKFGTAARTLGTVAKTAAVAGVSVATVAIVTNPRLVASAAGWVAEQFGLPAWVGVLALSMIAAAGIVWVINIAYKIIFTLTLPFTWPYLVGKRFAEIYRRRHPKRRRI